MIYQQIPMIRLARGARKLEKDGAWHAFGDDGRTHYRVVNNVMQRVRTEGAEDPALFRLFDDIDPLPSRAAKDGFREETRIVVEDDHYLLCNVLLRAYIGWEMLAEAIEQFRARLVYTGQNALEYRCEMEEFTREEFRKGLLLGKAVSIVGAQLAEDARLGIPHIKPEVNGLLVSAYTVLLEETGAKKSGSGKGKHPPLDDENQASLF